MGKGARLRQQRQETKQSLQYRDARRVMLMEVNAELSRSTDRFFYDEVCIILWSLHETFGFGKDRLKRFYCNYSNINQQLKKHYEMKDNDLHFLTDKLLKEIGVDIDAWEKEVS